MDSTKKVYVFALVVTLASTSLYPMASDSKQPLFLGLAGGMDPLSGRPSVDRKDITNGSLHRGDLKARVRGRLISAPLGSDFTLIAKNRQDAVSDAVMHAPPKTQDGPTKAVES